MEDFGLLPEPPLWALEEGLPKPRKGETFVPYVKRIGLRPAPLLVELTSRTIVLANLRLATALSRTMRPAFDRYVERLVRKHVTPQRQKELERIAWRVFGDSYRRRPNF